MLSSIVELEKPVETGGSRFIDSRLEELAAYKKQFESAFTSLRRTNYSSFPRAKSGLPLSALSINNVNEGYLPQLTVLSSGKASQSEELTLSWFQKKARGWMSPLSKPEARKIRAPKKLQPRHIQNPELKLSAQKVMENFIPDLSQIERSYAIPLRPELGTPR